MGFLSQVPLSARFLLYRAVRGGLATLRQGGASATQQNVYSPCGLAGQTTAERIYHCHQIFAHGGEGGIFLLTLRPTSIRKVHLRVSRKNAAAPHCAAQQNEGIPRGPSRANKGGKGIIPCRQYFTFALTIAREFLRLTSGPTFLLEVHPRVKRKMLSRSRWREHPRAARPPYNNQRAIYLRGTI